jgi:hypothetical protein
VVAADFDQDGGSDLSVNEYSADAAAVFLNRGTNNQVLPNVIVPGAGTHVIKATTPAGGAYTAGVSNALSLAAIPVAAKVKLTATPNAVINVAQTMNVSIAVATEDNYAPTGTASLYEGSTLVKTSALTNGALTVPMSFASAGELHANGEVQRRCKPGECVDRCDY